MKPESLLLAEIEAETLPHLKAIARLRRALADARHNHKLNQPLWSLDRDQLTLAGAADRIVESVALVTGVAPNVIRGRGRPCHIVAARHTTWWIIRHLLPQFTENQIAAHFRVSHGTISNAYRSIEARRVTEPKFAAQLQTLLTTLTTELQSHLPLNLKPQAA